MQTANLANRPDSDSEFAPREAAAAVRRNAPALIG